MAIIEAATILKGVSFLLGGGTTVALIKYFKLKEINRRKREEDQFRLAMMPFELARILDRKATIYNALIDIVSGTTATRACITRLENGGKLAMVGSPLYVSVIAEAYGKDLEELASKWQKARIDTTHETLLRALLTKKEMQVAKADLTQGQIKDAYKLHNIHRVKYFEIAQPFGLYFYLSIIFEDGEPDAIDELECMRVNVLKIKNIFAEDYSDFCFDRASPQKLLQEKEGSR